MRCSVTCQTLTWQVGSVAAIDPFQLQHWREMLCGVDAGLVGLDSVQPDFVANVCSVFRAHGNP